MKKDRINGMGWCVCCGESVGSRAAGALYCWPCNNLLQRANGRKSAAIKRAILSGLLKPPNQQLCADCGEPAKFYDHRDITKPLDVEPVCNGCNVRRGPPRINKEDLEKYLANLPMARKGRPKKAVKKPPKKPPTIEQLGIKRRFFNKFSERAHTLQKARWAYKKKHGLLARDFKDLGPPAAPVRRSASRTRC